MRLLCNFYSSLLFLLFFISSSTCLSAQLMGKANENGDPPPRIVISNWSNYMNSKGCVVLNGNGQLVVQVVVNVGLDNITAFPDIYFQFEFDGVNVIGGPVTDQLLEPVTINHHSLFQATFPYQFLYSDACTADPTAIIPIDYTISLITPDGNGAFIPYPIDQFVNSLFPIFLLEDIDGNINTNPVFTGTKNLCCEYGTADIELRSSTTQDEESLVFPNPFSEMIKVQHYQAQEGNLSIELFDATGKRSEHILIKNVQVGSFEYNIPTNHLAAGFYYCRINGTQTFKVVKL